MLYQVQFTVPSREEIDTTEDVAAFLSERTGAGWEEEETPEGVRCRVFFETPAKADAVAAQARQRWPESEPTVEERVPENWAMGWMDFFVPVACGERFEVLPPWLKDKASPDMTPIIIEPKMAFGTGHHATTSLCLAALSDLFGSDAPQPGKFLDLGTGSGILSIGLAMLGRNGKGLDIDPDAVACARENVETNGMAEHIELATGSLELLEDGEQFDIVVANILSGPLIEMAPRLRRTVAPGGSLILSGILEEQGQAVVNAYTACGLGEPERRVQGEWVALIWTEA